MTYLPRIVDSELDLRLRAVGATVIVGPKWCGKTTTAKQKARSVLEMQDPDLQEGYLKLAATKPSLLLEGANPRLIDEWQLAPVLWDAVRNAAGSPLATIIFEFLFCASAQGEDSKEKKGCGGKEEGKENLFCEFQNKGSASAAAWQR